MEYFDLGGEIELVGVSDFDPVKIFECGQCFRWDVDKNGIYTGVAYSHALRIRKDGDRIFFTCSVQEFEAIWRSYFDLDRDYAEIRRRLCIDSFMEKATAFGTGIRILRQDRWEALCSFIISQCNNIPRIKKIVSALCRLYGDEFIFDGEVFHTFPSAGRLATLNVDDLAPIRCGYRDEFIIGAARAVESGALDLDVLARAAPDSASTALKKLRGVGNKVADCALLFGLNMLDAFPVDIWMKRAVAEYFGPEFDPGKFSPYAGVAQQYIFYYVRSGK